MENFNIYRLKMSDGKYSLGGASPKFNSVGKTWKKVNHVKCHIKQVFEYVRYMELMNYGHNLENDGFQQNLKTALNLKQMYMDAVIETFKCQHVNKKEIKMKDFIDEEYYQK